VFAERVERFFERRYQRAPERHLATIRRFVVGLLAVVVLGVAPLFTSYVDASRAELVRTYLVVPAIALVGGRFALVPRWRRTHDDVETWLRGDRSPEQTRRAWESSKRLTYAGVRDGLMIGLPTLWLPGIVYTVIEYDLSLIGAAGALIAITLIAALCVVIGWPIVDEYLLPLRRDLARHLPTRVAVASVRMPLAAMMTAFVSVIGLLTGTIVTVVATLGERSIDEMSLLLVVTVVAGLGSGFAFASMMTRSLLRPLGDLVSVTEDVAGGRTDARALVTSDDEIGVLATGFNTMLDQLAAALEEVRASRSRILAASDAERKRIERNIHDGAQQQLTALALRLGIVREQLDEAPDLAARGLEEAVASLRQALAELRELAQGLHPSVLSTDGLAPALELLAERATLPVKVLVTSDRWSEAIEATAYFVASEALANVTKHASATTASVEVHRRDGRVVIEIADDGIGGASLDAGSGLTGLADRVAAVGGSLVVDSPRGVGTTIRAELPADRIETA